jgi:DNA invertase Pin-like site-specific DNA recombinase
MNKTYCVIRVSTDYQTYERQAEILKEHGYINGVDNCEYIEETYTGKTVKRPIFDDLIHNKIQKGDTIVATELSRISRSVKDWSELVDFLLYKKEANVIIFKENMHLKANGEMDAMTKFILNMSAIFAQFERDIISERTKESLRAKKINGTKSGRPIGKPRSNWSSKENFIKTIEYMINNNVGQAKATLLCHYPKDTFQKDIKKCYIKYNTKNYQEILEKIKEDTTAWELFHD